VAVRVRPLFADEQEDPSAPLKLDDGGQAISLSLQDRVRGADKQRRLDCRFDRVFGPGAAQEDVFAFAKPFVEKLAEGFNTTILAYGQTGTGKTHTMLGAGLEQLLATRPSTRATEAVAAAAAAAAPAPAAPPSLPPPRKSKRWSGSGRRRGPG